MPSWKEPGADPAGLIALRTLVAERLLVVEDLSNDDVQLALFCLFELHYGELDGVDDRWELHPGLIGIRHLLEAPLEAWLPAEAGTIPASVPRPDSRTPGGDATAALLFNPAAPDRDPSVFRHAATKATAGLHRQS